VDRLTRKELKQDKFAQEVGQTVEFLGEHKQQVIRYGAIALAVILVAVGWLYFSRHQKAARQKELAAAMELINAPVGLPALYGPEAYPSAADKDKAIVKAFTELAVKSAGSEEARIARYFLGTKAAEQGNFDEAVKHLTDAASGNSPYASLAKLALAEVYGSQNKIADAEKILKGLIEKPSALVSKEQATLALARLLASSRPDEARRLLEPLRAAPGPVGRAAVAALESVAANTLNTGS